MEIRFYDYTNKSIDIEFTKDDEKDLLFIKTYLESKVKRLIDDSDYFNAENTLHILNQFNGYYDELMNDDVEVKEC